jgi:Leucine-rich repeat (LRR) protein
LHIDQNGGQNAPSPKAFKGLLSAVVSKFPSLTNLYLYNCTTLATLPDNISHLSHLRRFYVKSTVFKAFPPSFRQLTALEVLLIQNCHALTIEGLAPLKHLAQLKYLKIFGKPTDDPAFPNWLCDNVPTSLEELRLDKLKSLPPAIGKFKHLTSLFLNEMVFNEVPESIGFLTALRQLWLHGRRVTLPASFSSLTALEKLRLMAKMDGIGPLQHLTGLQCLSAISSLRETLPYPNLLWNITSLTSLQLSHAGLNQLPTEISNFKNLKALDLQMNLVQEMECIGGLCTLTGLRVANCHLLQTLPESPKYCKDSSLS